jgi:prophage tail gpP-like protein
MAVYPNPLEVAVINTDGGTFSDWQSVWVHVRWGDGYSQFRFTAAEFSPMPTVWSHLKLLPGDSADIILGGQPGLLGGIITDRQVAYDANSHQVELSGVSPSWIGATSSVDVPPGSFDGMTFEAIARKVLEQYGTDVQTIGTLNARVFDYVQNQKGEPVWDFLESLARPRGIVLGSDEKGAFLLIGDHTYPVTATLIEGVNILKMQCTISIGSLFGAYVAAAQTQGSNDINGTAASEMEETQGGTGPPVRKIVAPATIPVRSTDELREIAANEGKWSEGTKVTANVTVAGWMRPGTATLWRAGDDVSVYSPMAVLNMPMKIQSVTFTQDRESGTLTLLELVLPWALNDKTWVPPYAPKGPDGIPLPPPPPPLPSTPSTRT